MAAFCWLILFLVEYNEDLDFTMDDLTSPYYGCSMMLNGEYFIRFMHRFVLDIYLTNAPNMTAM